MILAFLVSVAGAGALYWFVVLNPGDAIRPENIRSILGKESPVLYSDGKTRLGVFFSEAHRQYVPYDEIPVNFINALVASEDNRFFSHFGFDVFGIARATIKNIQSRRIVQGGSTLTQQTAKNLFKREERSLKAKLKELLFALRLEHHYSKEKIFEFYANQFYVSGNGHGLGVAARYYFDKKPEELSLLQCAYIAGSVKRPNAYNPFIKKTEEQREKALELGRSRVNYVLSKMLELGMISEYQHGLAKFSDIKFDNGRVGYSLDYVMEMVKDAVTSEEVTAALEEHNVANIATSGVRIITTVDKVMQEQALYSLRHDLSRLDVRLRGYEREQVQKELGELKYGGDTTLKVHAFLFGTIMDIPAAKDGSYEVKVDLGQKFGTGVIDKKGLTRLVTARARLQTNNPWHETKGKDYIAFLQQLQKDDRVWVSVLGRRGDGSLLLELEKFPEVNGGALVLKDGEIKAVAGGVENRFYNRAIYAKRTMGSSFKPFVFAAALQLGWNSADPLQNSRDVFIFQNKPYFPRPDHHSPFNQVSMSWAGVKSENVASVWLLYHLCDKLSSEQFRDVAAHVDMAPRTDGETGERYSQFRTRIRDSYGIVITHDILREAAFREAMHNIETDLIFAGRDREFESIRKMHYGLNFDAFKEEVEEELESEDEEPSESRKKELLLRQDILANNFLDFESLRRQLEEYKRSLWQQDSFFLSPAEQVREAGISEDQEKKAMLFYDEFARRYCFMRDPAASGGMRLVAPYNLQDYLQRLDYDQRQRFWQNIILEAKISVEAFDLLRAQVERELENLEKLPPYSMDILEHIQDYRILVGLHYLIAFARELGVESELKPVLSFPLGSNVVTLVEALRIYEALATGEVVTTSKLTGDENVLLSVIDRIETADGEVLFKPERRARRMLASETSIAIGHILENVIKHGTGRYADKTIKLTDAAGAEAAGFDSLGISIPVLGKTGTANRYTNASFLGFLPQLSEKKDSLSQEDGYAVGVYVGFDDNKPMKSGKTRISGAAGALPIWSEIVEAIVRNEKYAAHLDPVDLSFNGLRLERQNAEQVNVAVNPGQGGMIPYSAKIISQYERYNPSILTFGRIDGGGGFTPERQYVPFWQVTPLLETTLTQ